jgi:hypothetical protein
VAQLEEQIQNLRREQPSALGDDDRTMLLALAEDLPQLWNHPAASINPQADFASCPQGDHRHYRGQSAPSGAGLARWGSHSLEVIKNRSGQNRWKTDVEPVDLVRELARPVKHKGWRAWAVPPVQRRIEMIKIIAFCLSSQALSAWLQRPENVLAGYVTWSGYRNKERPTSRSYTTRPVLCCGIL